jgi:hypothetical protein
MRFVEKIVTVVLVCRQKHVVGIGRHLWSWFRHVTLAVFADDVKQILHRR